ncbi:unnamed protein product [Staurois parvus]|uniref:Uncharacterized protein n=1 Tax=Staurois parvus TaxID=386267 RepID=A0ABN9B6W4_9NEOB|nr:unnamed protein product [Staurois parvus]
MSCQSAPVPNKYSNWPSAFPLTVILESCRMHGEIVEPAAHKAG